MFTWIPGYEHLTDVINTEKRKIISKQIEGNIYLYKKSNIVVKERTPSKYSSEFCNICIEREFKVGLLVNEYNSEYIVKTIGYFIDNIDSNGLFTSYIVTEYVKGITLAELIRGNDYDPIIYKQVLYTIRHLHEEMMFTHYDLHFHNIIVNITSSFEKKSYIFGGRSHNINSRYNIKIIDLARIHIRGVESGYYETGIIDNATCPGIFDPLFDYATFLANVGFVGDDIDELYIKNGFSICDDTEVFDDKYSLIRGYPFTVNLYIMGDLFQNNKAWCSTYPARYTQKEVYRMYAEELITLNGVTPEQLGEHYDYLYEEEFSTVKYYIEDYANTQIADSKDAHRRLELIEKYTILLGQACVHDKLLFMKERQSTPEEFFDTCFQIIYSRL